MTPHFKFSEAIRTATGLANSPSPEVAAAIGVTAMRMEAVRGLLGAPILVNSWFRSPKVNQAVGGSKTSDHMRGHAVDFRCPGFGTPYEVASVIKDAIKYDQLILEYGWVHISFAPAMRGQVMTKKGSKSPYMAGLIK